VKQDVVPGMQIEIWFVPDRPGQYEIACSQLCGLGHYRMQGRLTVEPQEEFDKWLREAANGGI
jgi:cytochrome c oxidase subunit 2